MPLRAGGMNRGFSPSVRIIAQPKGGHNGDAAEIFHDPGNAERGASRSGRKTADSDPERKVIVDFIINE